MAHDIRPFFINQQTLEIFIAPSFGKNEFIKIQTQIDIFYRKL
jgi:hypothetical protein